MLILIGIIVIQQGVIHYLSTPFNTQTLYDKDRKLGTKLIMGK